MDNHPFWASILRRSLFRYTCAGLCPNLFIQHVYREFIHPVHWIYSAWDKGWNRVLHLSHSQLHFCKAVGDLSSSSQDLHQKPGAFKSQPAAGPEGLLSKVKDIPLLISLQSLMHAHQKEVNQSTLYSCTLISRKKLHIWKSSGIFLGFLPFRLFSKYFLAQVMAQK